MQELVCSWQDKTTIDDHKQPTVEETRDICEKQMQLIRCEKLIFQQWHPWYKFDPKSRNFGNIIELRRL